MIPLSRPFASRLVALSGALVLAHCNDDAATTEPPYDGPTWYRDVQPIVSLHCAGCHAAGGSGPFALTSYEDAAPRVEAIGFMVRSGLMPPWKADPNCRDYLDDRTLDPADKATILAWTDAGGPAGSAKDAVLVTPPAPLHLATVDISATSAAPYTPKAGPDDDYRCFVIQHDFTTDTFVTGYEFFPDVGPIVHHAALFMAAPGSDAALAAQEVLDPEPGYTCFGDANVERNDFVGAWAPGMGAQIYPADSALVVPAGARLVLQIHYNLVAAPPSPDLTRVTLSTRATPPAKRIRQVPLVNMDIVVPAGDPNSVWNRDLTFDDWLKDFVGETQAGLTVIGYFPHLHLIGRHTRGAVVDQATGVESACLVDIPKWDFHWQHLYMFEEPVHVAPGQALRLTCAYDNSAANQPIIEGVARTPAEVRWGESSSEEMCVGILITIEDYQP